MKFTISTTKLKELGSRAVKGVGNVKDVPVTCWVAIEVFDNKLTLITRDTTNYLYLVENGVVTEDGEDFYAVVDANVFFKLISKLTCEKVTLEVDGFSLIVHGNGTYKLVIQTDEEGEKVKYIDPIENLDMSKAVTKEFNRTTIQVIFETIKPALGLPNEVPEGSCYSGYYVGQNVVATNSIKIASMAVPMLDSPKLISSQLFNLLSVMNNEKIEVYIVDDEVVFSTADCVIYGRFMSGIEDYAIDEIMELVNSDFVSFCSVPKKEFLQSLDRLSAVVGVYDNDAVFLTFTQNGLQVSSKSTDSVEIISYSASEDFHPFMCAIDIQTLIDEVKSINNDMIELYYGRDNGIKLTDGNITIIVALYEESDVD